MASSKAERQANSRNALHCSCGNEVSIQRQEEGRHKCPRCDPDIDTYIDIDLQAKLDEACKALQEIASCAHGGGSAAKFATETLEGLDL